MAQDQIGQMEYITFNDFQAIKNKKIIRNGSGQELREYVLLLKKLLNYLFKL